MDTSIQRNDGVELSEHKANRAVDPVQNHIQAVDLDDFAIIHHGFVMLIVPKYGPNHMLL